MPDSRKFRKRAQDFLDDFIHSLNIGEFQGDFSLEWISPEQFQYIPDSNDPFRYLRKDKQGNVIETITPQTMKTSGGSIPQIAQVALGTTAWEYGPAYMIHDWEFLAHDKARDTPSFQFDKSFEEVNLTFAEAIWTLMNIGYKGEQADRDKAKVQFVYSGVMSPIGRYIWDK